MSISGKFHDSTSAAAISGRLKQQEAIDGHAEFQREFNDFCRILGMKVGELDKLPQLEVMTLMLMRLFKLVSFKIQQLDDRTTSTEDILQ